MRVELLAKFTSSASKSSNKVYICIYSFYLNLIHKHTLASSKGLTAVYKYKGNFCKKERKINYLYRRGMEASTEL